MKIRDLEVTDMADVLRLGPIMHQESETFKHHDYDDLVVVNFVASLIHMEEGIAICAEDEDGSVVGGILGIVSPHWFGTGTMAYDIALFVQPDKRGKMVAVRLVKEYAERARKLGANHTMIINSAGMQLDALYEKAGFEKVGGVFNMRN